MTHTCVSAPIVLFKQTAPSYPVVCPGDRLVFTCIISDVNSYWSGQMTDGIAHWREGNGAIRQLYNGYSFIYDSFLVSPYINDTTAVVTAANEAAPMSLNGTSVGCSHSLQSSTFKTLFIETAGY